MNKFYKFSPTIIIILILQIAVFSQSSKQLSDSLQIKKHNPNDCLSMVQFFRDAILLAGKNGGIALTNNSCSEEIIFPDLKPNELSLNQKLDLIIQKYSDYKWKDENGSINLLPSKAVPKLLKTRIKEVTVSFTNNLGIAAETVLNTSEVIKEKKKLGLRDGLYFGGLQPPPSNKPLIVMVYYRKTLQEILNELARKTGRGIWIYQEAYFNGTKTFTINFMSS